MRNIRQLGWMLLIASTFIINSCQRRPLEDELSTTALIPVRIDWSKTGFSQLGRSTEDYVHRVSIRFFPKDGSPAFDRYLETNINEGEIMVPLGSYSVIIFNESVYDTYWQDAIRFTDVDDYANFAANIIEEEKSPYDYFTFAPDEKLIVEPKRLASWSLDDFEVTQEMITRTRSKSTTKAISRSGEDMTNALTEVVMRPLTYQERVLANVTFLSSAQRITGIQRGFASKVYMASAKTANAPASYVFVLNGRRWADATMTDGTTEKSFLTFGALPSSVTNAKYTLDLDVLFTTGERYVPAPPLRFDITDQIPDHISIELNIDVNIAIDLPKVEGGIHVGEWDDEIIELK